MVRRTLAVAVIACSLSACPGPSTGDGGVSATGGSAGPSTAGSTGGGSVGGSSSGSGSTGAGSSIGGNGSSSASSGSGTTGAASSSGGGTGASVVECAAAAGASPVCAITIDSPENCGGCGVNCSGTQVCSYGSCQTALPFGQGCSYSLLEDGGVLCDSANTTFCSPPSDAGYGSDCPCPSLQSDPNNCGACGNVCTGGQVCTAGSCVAACSSGQVEDLSLLADNGSACLPAVDAQTQVTVGPLSFTNTVCPATATASAYLASLDYDPNNCGACGHACPTNDQCVDGTCVTTCGGNTQECTDSVDGGDSCAAGMSYCPNSDFSNCPCYDLQGDPLNCGACGNVCRSGACQAGVCVSGCPAGEICSSTSANSTGLCTTACPLYFGLQMAMCGTGAAVYCTVLSADSSNCGSCGNVCPTGQTCADGTCAPECGEGGAQCGNTNCGVGQTCVDGGCAASCAAGQVCSQLYSACVASCN